MESVPEFRKTTGRRSLSDGYRDTWTATSSLARGLAPRRRTRVVPAGVTDRRRVRCLFQRQQSIRMLQHAMARGLRNRVGRDAAHERRILPPEHSQKRAAPRTRPRMDPTATHAVSPPHGSSGAFLATMRLDAFQRFKDRQPSCKTAWVADRSMGIPATAGSVTGPNTSGSPRFDQLRSFPFTAPHRRRAAPQLPDSRCGRRSVGLPRPMVRPSKPIAYACPHCARTPYPRSNRRS